MLCQSNDHDEKNKYRYTLKINNDDMTSPKFKNETVVNCNVRYVVNKELLNELDLKYAKLGFISKKDITAIDNLWKEAYQRDEHSFLHILNVECVQEKLIYDVVDDNGRKFKQKIDSSKQRKKEQKLRNYYVVPFLLHNLERNNMTNKTIRKELRFSVDEIQMLESKAKQLNMNISEYIRYCISKTHDDEFILTSTQLFDNNQQYLHNTIKNVIERAINYNSKHIIMKAVNELIKEREINV